MEQFSWLEVQDLASIFNPKLFHDLYPQFSSHWIFQQYCLLNYCRVASSSIKCSCLSAWGLQQVRQLAGKQKAGLWKRKKEERVRALSLYSLSLSSFFYRARPLYCPLSCRTCCICKNANMRYEIMIMIGRLSCQWFFVFYDFIRISLQSCCSWFNDASFLF